MPSYVVTRVGSETIEQVVRYSAAPPARVFDTYTAQGQRLVRITGPAAAARAREIIRAPNAWRIRDDQVERRVGAGGGEP